MPEERYSVITIQGFPYRRIPCDGEIVAMEKVRRLLRRAKVPGEPNNPIAQAVTIVGELPITYREQVDESGWSVYGYKPRPTKYYTVVPLNWILRHDPEAYAAVFGAIMCGDITPLGDTRVQWPSQQP